MFFPVSFAALKTKVLIMSLIVTSFFFNFFLALLRSSSTSFLGQSLFIKNSKSSMLTDTISVLKDVFENRPSFFKTESKYLLKWISSITNWILSPSFLNTAFESTTFNSSLYSLTYCGEPYFSSASYFSLLTLDSGIRSSRLIS